MSIKLKFHVIMMHNFRNSRHVLQIQTVVCRNFHFRNKGKIYTNTNSTLIKQMLQFRNNTSKIQVKTNYTMRYYLKHLSRCLTES